MYDHFDAFSRLANNLSNAALFRLRQNFTMRGKDDLSDNEKEVLAEIDSVMEETGRNRPKAVINYYFLESMMRVTKNPDFFAGLPMQTAQQVLKERIRDMKSWLEALRAYKRDPSSFTGKPRIPDYAKKGGKHTFTMTNQDCVIKRMEDGVFLKLPRIKHRVQIENAPENAVLKEVKVRPYYDAFELLYTYECDDVPPNGDLAYMAGIDIGVDNTVSIVTNNGHALIVKGGAVKAANQWFNKQRAKYVSAVTTGDGKYCNTRMLDSLSMNRAQFILDVFHQVSRRVIAFCLAHRVGTIVIGRNKYWKQHANVGKKNNQSFVSVPFDMLRGMISYKAEAAGIRVILQEESYTSKASFLDKDRIPTYGVDDHAAAFSGKRIRRGLYQSANGTIINADINGAANILKKAEQTAYEDVHDFTYLQNPEVIHFTDLHKRTPIKGIAAA